MEAYSLKDSGVDWLGEIPIYWRIRKVKRDFDVLLGKMIQPEQKREHDKEYFYLRAANIDWAGVKINDIKKMWFQPFEVKKYALKYGDLLVSEGGDVGKSTLWSNELKNCFYQNAINRVRAKQSNDTRFLYYWIYFLKHIGYVDSIVNRITIAHLTAEKLEALPILICSPMEQKSIANYLDKACQNIDKTISLKQQQLEKLEAYRKSVIHEVVTKGLDKTVTMKDSGVGLFGKIPQTWRMQRIKGIVKIKITDGPHETPQLEDTGIPFISAESIKFHKIDFNKKRGFIRRELHEIYSKKCKPQKFDIFIIKSGATTGNVAYVDTDIEFNIWSPLALIRCEESLAHYKFMYYQFLGDVFRKQVELSWSFGTQENIGMGVLGRIKISLPPIQEQKKIAGYLDNVCGTIISTRENIEKQIKTLTQYRQSLIHECVTGKKRVYQGNK